MTRKESEKDADRTHYYSQFWLDIAAGRRIIGAPKPEDEAAESDVLEATPTRKSSREASYDDDDVQYDGRDERIVHPVAEPLATPEDFTDSDIDEIDLDADSSNAPDLQDDVVDDLDIPDVDLSPTEVEGDDDLLEEVESDDEEDEESDEGSTENEEEEDDDIGWGGRGRKRNKPVRPKAPPKKAPRREPRRGY